MIEILLTQGQVAMIDDDDFELVSQHKWFAERRVKRKKIKWYACTNIWVSTNRFRILRMHSLIMGKKPGLEIDHKDNNGLNNQKSNLRFVTRAQNLINRSGRSSSSSKYKGVSLSMRNGKWMARICRDGRQIYLGYFDNEVKAAEVYDEAAKVLHEEFARLNFPE